MWGGGGSLAASPWSSSQSPIAQLLANGKAAAAAAGADGAAAAAAAGADAAKPKPKPGHSPPPASHSPQANAGWRGSGRRERSRVRAETQRPLPRAARRRRWGWRMPQLHHLALVGREESSRGSGCLSSAAATGAAAGAEDGWKGREARKRSSNAAIGHWLDKEQESRRAAVAAAAGADGGTSKRQIAPAIGWGLALLAATAPLLKGCC